MWWMNGYSVPSLVTTSPASSAGALGNPGVRTLYGDQPAEADIWDKAGREYLSLVDQRLLAALFAQNWQDDSSNAVFLAPAFTFLMRNRFVDYQFWLDAGNSSWSERLEQPLTHPYVLRRDYPADMIWTSPGRITEPVPMLSLCSSAPSRT